MSLTLRRTVVNREPPRPAICPPLPRRASDAEPIRLLPIAETRAPRRVRAGWLRRLRNWLLRWREESIRAAWAAGFNGGRLAERTDLRAYLTAELQRGAYDYCGANAAVRSILGYLAEEQQQER